MTPQWATARAAIRTGERAIIDLGKRTITRAQSLFVRDACGRGFFGRLIGLPGCFEAGTQVIVGIADDGSFTTKSIEEIQPGETVLSLNESGDDATLEPRSHRHDSSCC